MNCPFCKKKTDIKQFDNPSAHCIITMKDGDIHVHGPFNDPPMIKKFIGIFIAEAEKNGIIYKQPAER